MRSAGHQLARPCVGREDRDLTEVSWFTDFSVVSESISQCFKISPEPARQRSAFTRAPDGIPANPAACSSHFDFDFFRLGFLALGQMKLQDSLLHLGMDSRSIDIGPIQTPGENLP